MSAMSLRIVCFLKTSFLIGVFAFHSNQTEIFNGFRTGPTTSLVFINSIKTLSNVLPKDLEQSPSLNSISHAFLPNLPAAKNAVANNSGIILSKETKLKSFLVKRKRRQVTFPTNRSRMTAVGVGLEPLSFGTQFLANNQTQSQLSIDKDSILQVPGFVRQNRTKILQNPFHENHRIPIPEISAPNSDPKIFVYLPTPRNRGFGPSFLPKTSREIPTKEWNRFLPNLKPEFQRTNLNRRLSIIIPDFRLRRTNPRVILPNSGFRFYRLNPGENRLRVDPKEIMPGSNQRHFNPERIQSKFEQKNIQRPETKPRSSRRPPLDVTLPSLKKDLHSQYPEVDWGAPVPWPREGQVRESSVRPTEYPLFPWWQKRLSVPDEKSDPHSNRENDRKEKQDGDVVTKANRGDVQAPDSCLALISRGDCNFYQCFDQRHPCPVEQNFAYNVASYLCRRTHDYLNFFDNQGKNYLQGVKKCHMEALIPTYKAEVVSCAEIEAIGLDILTGGILPRSVDDVSCFFQNKTFCKVMEDPQNVQLLYDLYGGNGYTEYRIFIHFVKLIQNCSSVALRSFNERFARRFITFDD